MHIFQSLVLPIVEKELVKHESDIGRELLTHIHALINKFIAYEDKRYKDSLN